LPIDLTPLLPHLPVWALVLFRLSGIFFFAPMIGSQAIPVRVKILLALGLSFCIYPVLLTPGSRASLMVGQVLAHGMSLPGMIGAVASELLIGLAIGFGAVLPLTGMQLAGLITDQQLGFGIGGIFNPDLAEESGVVGQVYFQIALVLFVIAGGHRVMVRTLVGTFDHIPLGGFYADADFLRLMTAMVAASFDLALRVSAPLLCLVFLETIVMGFIARTVPQMNILSVGFALRILVGALVIIAAMSSQTGVFLDAMRTNLHQLQGFFAGG
jgi:flagellar biosynthetic protein FliR